MHILLIHQAFASLDEPGGTRHHELARFLATRGHQVTVIASPVSYLTGVARTPHIPWVERQDGGPGVTVLRAYTFPALHRSFVHRVFSFLSFMFSSLVIGLGVRQVDLVWGTSPPIFQGATAWSLARVRRVPFLFEVRDLWPAFAIAVGVLKQPALIRMSEWLERFLYRQADQVIVNSPGFQEHVQARGAQRVTLVPNGAEASMFQPDAGGEAFRQKHGLEGRFVVMYAGAHGMSNDLETVLAAADQLRALDELAIVLLGDGKEKPALMAQAAEMGLTNVRFLAPIPKTEIPEALAAADACLAILKPVAMYATVYPNKVFDYMAAGRPVILAIQGVIREVVEQAGAGLPVSPGDAPALAAAIRQLAQDQESGRVMGARGRQAVEQLFDRPVLAEKLARLMEELGSAR
ncbi:MAG TPA: glycosyltransferase family 4 protein [Anaerolineales bacterium]|nr:glycosyltransferase family 4 protein [Anaerolineales bacterium]